MLIDFLRFFVIVSCMKLVRFDEFGYIRPGVVLDGGILLDVSERVGDYDRNFFSSGGICELRDWVDAGCADAVVVDREVHLVPPISMQGASLYMVGAGLDLDVISMCDVSGRVDCLGEGDSLVYGEMERVEFESVSVACVLGEGVTMGGNAGICDLLVGCVVMSSFRVISPNGVSRCCGFGSKLVTADELGRHPLTGDFSRCWSRRNKHHALVAWFVEMGLCMRTVLERVLESQDAGVGDVIAISNSLCNSGRGIDSLPLGCGDLLECGVDGLGVTRHRVVAA